jgi:hypothetical protein
VLPDMLRSAMLSAVQVRAGVVCSRVVLVSSLRFVDGAADA